MNSTDPCPRHLYALRRELSGEGHRDCSYLVFQTSPERGIARVAAFPYNLPQAEHKINVVVHDRYPDGSVGSRDWTVDPHQWYGMDWIRWVWDYFSCPDGGRAGTNTWHGGGDPPWLKCDPPEWATEWFTQNPPKNEVNI